MVSDRSSGSFDYALAFRSPGAARPSLRTTKVNYFVGPDSNDGAKDPGLAGAEASDFIGLCGTAESVPFKALLLIPQGHDWFHLRRPESRNVTGQKCYGGQHERESCKGQRIAGTHSV